VLVFYAPHYLAYSDDAERCDAVILFLGPDYEARKKEAHRLIQEGFADYLMIPAHSKVLTPGKDEKLEILKQKAVTAKRPSRCRNLYEDTHLEALYAKDMMDRYKLTSAIFVSSPVHMRRIKIIADRVFDRKAYRLSFVPTRYEKPWGYLWWTDRDGSKQVISEYVKIAWFLIYVPFVER